MSDNYYTPENESRDRNGLLVMKHGKIPSYALWRGDDIEKQSFQERYNWWEKEDDTKISNQLVLVQNG